MTEGKKSNKVLMFVGIGCVGLITMCCCTGGGAVMWRSTTISDAARVHVEFFMSSVQGGNWDAAYGATQYMGDLGMSSSAQFQMCVSGTPLSDMLSYTCADTDVDLADGDADVICNVVSASQGPQDITIHVNSPTEFPYLGFIWFSPGANLGTSWPSDECTLFSGREYFDNPPEGRVRPGPSGYGF